MQNRYKSKNGDKTQLCKVMWPLHLALISFAVFCTVSLVNTQQPDKMPHANQERKLLGEWEDELDKLMGNDNPQIPGEDLVLVC